MRPSSVKRIAWSIVAIALVVFVIGYWHNKADAKRDLRVKAHMLTGGNPDQGRQLIAAYGCGGCHTIPGVPGAAGKVGPSLAGIGAQVYIAGRLNNEPQNLVAWVQNPRAIDPQTAMPYLGVTEAQARDIAAYLYTLD